MKVKAGALHPWPGSLPEPEGQMGLVGGFIEAEAGIPVEAEDFSPQRIAGKLHVGMDGII